MSICFPADYLGRPATLATNVHQITTETSMQNSRRIPLRKSAIDRTLDRAVQRIYETYGSDLTRFFAAVQKRQTQESQESAEIGKENAAGQKTGARAAPDQAG